jgi:preprotein translocase subunit SecG
MYALILSIHILVCLALVVVVLLQSGKGGGLAGGAFGGTAQTVFGGRGATDFMTRATMVLGGAFFVTSLALALLASGSGGATRSLIQEQARRAAPQVPGSAPGQAPSQQAPSQSPPSQQAPAPQTPATQPPATPPATGGGR